MGIKAWPRWDGLYTLIHTLIPLGTATSTLRFPNHEPASPSTPSLLNEAMSLLTTTTVEFGILR